MPVNRVRHAALQRGMPPARSPVAIRFGRLGDTVLLQPLLQKLHRRYGQPCHLLALGDWPHTLYAQQPEVAACIRLLSQNGPLWLRPQRLRATLALRRLRGAPFYICEPALRAGSKVRSMLALAGIPAADCSFIEDLPLQDGEHWVDWLLRFGDTVPPSFAKSPLPSAAAGGAAPMAPGLHVSAAERADGEAWLRAHGMAGRPLVLLQPANKRTMRWNGVRDAVDDDKSWPAERWATLARAIGYRLPQAQILFCGAPAEAGYLDMLRAVVATPGLRVDTATLPLGRLKALLAQAHSMVSVDTGPAHLAAAVGCPLVVLMGARWPQMWGPRSAGGSAVVLLGGLPQVSRVDEIDAGQVVTAWRELPLRPEDRSEAGAQDDDEAALQSAGWAG
jgi:heptosyltransferase-2/heptosyltransferase-3